MKFIALLITAAVMVTTVSSYRIRLWRKYHYTGDAEYIFVGPPKSKLKIRPPSSKLITSFDPQTEE